MEFKVLAVGDVVGNPGLDRVRRHLRQLKRKTGAHFAVVNGENAAVVGMLPHQAEEILDAGADVITMGNHTWSKREIVDYMEDCPQVLRPANYAPQVPGRGWRIFDSPAGEVAVIDLIGRCNMDYGPDNPFLIVEKILKEIDTKLILVELHAEATSEKLAMGYMLDGKVTAVWGTHTHVPTADEQILPHGTGYITDVGMTGPKMSILGVTPELAIEKMKTNLPVRFQNPDGEAELDGVIFTVSRDTAKTVRIQRISL